MLPCLESYDHGKFTCLYNVYNLSPHAYVFTHVQLNVNSKVSIRSGISSSRPYS